MDGYLLVSPLKHAYSLAELDDLRTLGILVDEIRAIVTDVYGPCVIFEHGMTAAARVGGCVDHAHLHVAPVDLPVLELFPKYATSVVLENWDQLAAWRGQSYLLAAGVTGLFM